jgi:hypothetical protein
MSESFEQVPGQEQVRHACRITPHPTVKGAVQVFVEGLQFPVTNIFDAPVNLLERGLIAEDPRMQQEVNFWFLTRVSERTYIVKNENSPRNGQPAYYVDVVKLWRDGEEEPEADNVISLRPAPRIRQPGGTKALPPLEAEELRSQLAGVVGRLMTVEVVSHDFERRLAALEARVGPAGKPAAEEGVVTRGPKTVEVPVAASGPSPAEPQDDLFDRPPARPNDTIYRFPTGTEFGDGVRALMEAVEIKSMADMTMRMYGAPEHPEGKLFTAPAAEQMANWLDALVQPQTVANTDRALNGARRVEIIMATFNAAQTYAEFRRDGADPHSAQIAANATWVWTLNRDGSAPEPEQLAAELLRRISAHKNEKVAEHWHDAPLSQMERHLSSLLAGCPRDAGYLDIAMPFVWRSLVQAALKPNQQARELMLNQHNGLIKRAARIARGEQPALL